MPYLKFIILIALAISGFIIAYWLKDTAFWTLLQNTEALHKFTLELGAIGPILIITLLALAIIMSPLPSAPIALVAGAVYGHTLGTIYVLIGSELGAIIAFLIARHLGYDYVQSKITLLSVLDSKKSQNFLMITVFLSRLMPFISFDVISYAAGLTPLSFWRFALATIGGILPASFLLAHFGSEMADMETNQILLAIFAIGIIVVIPLLLLRHRNNN